MSCMREDNVSILRTIIHDVMYERGQCQYLEDYIHDVMYERGQR